MSSKWPIKKLGELCTLTIGKTPYRDNESYWGVGYPWLSISDMKQGKNLSFTKEHITELAIKKCGIKLVPEGTLVMSFKLSIGKLGILTKNMYTNEAIVALHINDNKILHRDYLYFALQFVDLLKSTDRAAMGKTLNKTSLALIDIPLPPLEAQKQMSAILEKADNLSKQCHQVKQELNALIQSVFLEMFGDPVTNPKRWKRCLYKDLGKVQTGNTPPRNENANYGAFIEWIKSDNIREENIYLSESEERLSERGVKFGRVVPKGAVLVTCIAGSSKTIGNAAIANRDVAFNQQINSITPNEDVESIFLYGLCRVMKRIIQNSTTSGMKRIIIKSNFEKIEAFKPPLLEQKKFSKAFGLIESLSAKQKKKTLYADTIFCSLLAKIFNGEFKFKSVDNIIKTGAQTGHV